LDYFNHKNNELYCEDIPVSEIIDKYGTPAYIYSLKTLVRHFDVTNAAFGDIPHLICYAAKANSHQAILKTAAICGAGADVVSGGELEFALKAGIDNKNIVFSGVGKTDDEIRLALKREILFICAESMDELKSISGIAEKMKIKAPVAIRINPNINPKTHPYIATGLRDTKFGIAEDDALKAFRHCQRDKWLNPIGISMHIGSQVEYVKPYVDAVKKIVAFYKDLRKQNIVLKYIDIGGGWAAHFERESKTPHPDDYVLAVAKHLKNIPAKIIVEPGRSIVGNAGILVMKITTTKLSGPKRYYIVDAGMNDFIRPPLYGAIHRIEPVKKSKKANVICDVVGPVCESSDFFAKGIKLPRMKIGDSLALFTAGAYGAAMGSNYNSRCRIPEIAIAGKKIIPITKRETLDDIIARQNNRGINEKLIGGLR
jgi:diaminopimelate decarboxylase